MKDLEEKVRAMNVVEPSVALDRRIARLFSGSDRSVGRMPFALRKIPIWGCAAACVAALLVGVLYGRSTAPTEAKINGSVAVYYVLNSGGQATGNLFDWTDQRDHFLESASGEDIHVAVSQAPKAG